MKTASKSQITKFSRTKVSRYFFACIILLLLILGLVVYFPSTEKHKAEEPKKTFKPIVEDPTTHPKKLDENIHFFDKVLEKTHVIEQVDHEEVFKTYSFTYFSLYWDDKKFRYKDISYAYCHGFLSQFSNFPNSYEVVVPKKEGGMARKTVNVERRNFLIIGYDVKKDSFSNYDSLSKIVNCDEISGFVPDTVEMIDFELYRNNLIKWFEPALINKHKVNYPVQGYYDKENVFYEAMGETDFIVRIDMENMLPYDFESAYIEEYERLLGIDEKKDCMFVFCVKKGMKYYAFQKQNDGKVPFKNQDSKCSEVGLTIVNNFSDKRLTPIFSWGDNIPFLTKKFTEKYNKCFHHAKVSTQGSFVRVARPFADRGNAKDKAPSKKISLKKMDDLYGCDYENGNKLWWS